jgi:transcriptional regulator with XRE-family HTH domain
MTESRPIAAIVGENVRRLRTQSGHSGDALARRMRQTFKTAWNTARVSELENGRVSPTAPTLFMLSQALSELLDRPVLVAELLDSDGFAKVGNVGIRATRVAAAFRQDDQGDMTLRIGDLANADELLEELDEHFHNGKPLPKAAGGVRLELVTEVADKSGESERRAALSLGIPEFHLAALSAALWGHSYSEERDRRAGADSSAQKRGRIGRELLKELQKAAASGDDQ